MGPPQMNTSTSLYLQTVNQRLTHENVRLHNETQRMNGQLHASAQRIQILVSYKVLVSLKVTVSKGKLCGHMVMRCAKLF